MCVHIKGLDQSLLHHSCQQALLIELGRNCCHFAECDQVAPFITARVLLCLEGRQHHHSLVLAQLQKLLGAVKESSSEPSKRK
jgi:hypothetical protein